MLQQGMPCAAPNTANPVPAARRAYPWVVVLQSPLRAKLRGALELIFFSV